MKIVHICISAPFIDGWGYQENLLPRYLQKHGTENYVIASANDFPNYLRQELINEIKSKGNAYVVDGVKTYRIRTKKVTHSLVLTMGLRDLLKEIRPDVIFHHNFNCTSLPIAARYSKKHGIPLMVDNHADTINMSKNKIWVFVYYRMLIYFSTKYHQKDIYKAYGVTHSRCDFIHDYYGLDNKKIDFLPIGVDVDLANTISSVLELRRKYGIEERDYVVVSGGKLGIRKGTDNLIRVVENLHKEFPRIKLLLFGLFEDTDTEEMANNSPITMVHGWCDRIKTLELLKLANVACWPVHHTTLIEDALSVCVPIVIRKTSTTEHLIDGNGIGMESGDEASLKVALSQLIFQDKQKRERMLFVCKKMIHTLSYHTIVKKILSDIEGYRKQHSPKA